MRCILFDIDGTLIASGSRVQVASYGHAIRSVFGIETSLHDIVPHGKLDGQIFPEILAAHGVARAQAVERLPELYAARLAYLVEQLQAPQAEAVLAGVPQLLEALAARGRGTVLGVVTGNETRAAWHRLERAGLRRYFAVGAFGEEAERRADLVRIAAGRAAALAGEPVPPRATFVVGDTPRDVECGRANGAPVIAVATGLYDAAALRKAGADLVLDDLTRVQEFARFVDGAA